jgi:hypothetical protein
MTVLNIQHPFQEIYWLTYLDLDLFMYYNESHLATCQLDVYNSA